GCSERETISGDRSSCHPSWLGLGRGSSRRCQGVRCSLKSSCRTPPPPSMGSSIGPRPTLGPPCPPCRRCWVRSSPPGSGRPRSSTSVGGRSLLRPPEPCRCRDRGAKCERGEPCADGVHGLGAP